jgi:hypothetical protein
MRPLSRALGCKGKKLSFFLEAPSRGVFLGQYYIHAHIIRISVGAAAAGTLTQVLLAIAKVTDTQDSVYDNHFHSRRHSVYPLYYFNIWAGFEDQVNAGYFYFCFTTWCLALLGSVNITYEDMHKLLVLGEKR